MESNLTLSPGADIPRAASGNNPSPSDSQTGAPSRSRKDKRSSETAASSRSESPDPPPRESRNALRRRFGRKSVEPGRIARHYPTHEADAEASLAVCLVDESGSRRLDDSSTSNGHPRDRIGELVRIAALLDGLRRNGGGLNEERFASLWSEAWRQSNKTARAASADDAPLEQVLAAEVLFASSILFEDAKDMRTRQKDARAKLIVELEARTDTDGAPHASLLPVLPAWFASLTRCAHWSRSHGVRLWNAEYADRFDGLLRTVAMMTAGRSIALGGDADLRPVLKDALKLSGWKHGSPAHRLVRRIVKSDGVEPIPSRESAPRKIDRSSPPASQSDWAKLVVSRTRWSADADSLAIAHHSALPAIEFAAFGRRVFSGTWDFRVRIDDDDMTLPSECDAVCWFSDADADYVELQWTTEPGLVICRQAMLTRGDHQLLLADSVSAPSRPEARIEIEASLPLAKGTAGEILRPGRELRLRADDVPLRCIPIGLPMDHLLRGAGSLEPEIDRVVVRQNGIGAVFVPILMDWHPQRRDVPADWRTLTVTEDGRKLGPEAAAGCRVRLGKRQLLVYRNLNASKAKRAVLGHHHDHETVIGRFTSDGDVDPLVFVE